MILLRSAVREKYKSTLTLSDQACSTTLIYLRIMGTYVPIVFPITWTQCSILGLTLSKVILDLDN